MSATAAVADRAVRADEPVHAFAGRLASLIVRTPHYLPR